MTCEGCDGGRSDNNLFATSVLHFSMYFGHFCIISWIYLIFLKSGIYSTV